MSYRVWVGKKPVTRANFYDWRLDEFDMDLEKLAEKCAWHCPLRVYSNDGRLLVGFLRILEEKHFMSVDDLDQVKVVE